MVIFQAEYSGSYSFNFSDQISRFLTFAISTALQGLLSRIWSLLARFSALRRIRNARFHMLLLNFSHTIATIHVVTSIAFRRHSIFGPRNGTMYQRSTSSYPLIRCWRVFF